jgi:hypothetical protein
MNRQKANLIHAVTQIFVSFWIYYDAVQQGIHQLFPLAMGIILLALNNGIIFENKGQIRMATLITILSILFLAKMSWETLSEDNYREGVFYAIMLATGMFSAIFMLANLKLRTK